MEEVDGKKKKKMRSFRSEDYNNRRVFLRSYPLQWEEEEEEEEEEEGTGRAENGKSKVMVSLKHRFVDVFQWSGGKVVLLRKIKNKVAFYLVACHPFGFKPSSSNHLLTV